jgi:hypothetical protein
MSACNHFYPIGSPLTPWGSAERAEWLAHVGHPRRSYAEEVVAQLEPLRETFDVVQYGALSQDPERYPLFCVMTRNWDEKKPCVLVTGGVHGYETSGVQGSLFFLRSAALKYAQVMIHFQTTFSVFFMSHFRFHVCSQTFNIAVCPCVCPWGYETVQVLHRYLF